MIKNPKQVSNKIIGSTGDKFHHLQYSSLDTMHIWTTHSIHKSAEDAEKALEVTISKFPKYYKWRIQKIKLIKK